MLSLFTKRIKEIALQQLSFNPCMGSISLSVFEQNHDLRPPKKTILSIDVWYCFTEKASNALFHSHVNNFIGGFLERTDAETVI